MAGPLFRLWCTAPLGFLPAPNPAPHPHARAAIRASGAPFAALSRAQHAAGQQRCTACGRPATTVGAEQAPAPAPRVGHHGHVLPRR